MRRVNQIALIRLFLVVLVLCAARHGQAQVRYTVRNLGTLGGPTVAYGVNRQGQVVGYSTLPNGLRHAIRVNPAGTLVDLGVFGGEYTESTAHSINDSGVIAGIVTSPAYGYLPRIFRSSGSSLSEATDDLGVDGRGAVGAFVSASGAVASSSYVGLGDSRAFVTPLGRAFLASDDLGAFAGGYSVAAGINASEQVVGTTRMAGGSFGYGSYVAFRTAPGAAISEATDGLGTLGGNLSYGMAVNDAGQAIGFSNISFGGLAHAFRTAPNKPINATSDDLGVLPGTVQSFAFGINNSGEVVGQCSDVNGLARAFVFRAGAMGDLNARLVGPGSVGILLREGRGINDAGQVIANGFDAQGRQAAFLLTPVADGPLGIEVDESLGRGLLGGKAQLTNAPGSSPLTATLTPKTSLKLWLGIVSTQKSPGVALRPADNAGTVPPILAALKLLAPSTAPAFTGEFPKVGDMVVMNVQMTTDAAMLNIVDLLLTLGKATGADGFTVDDLAGDLNDILGNLYKVSALTKAAKRFAPLPKNLALLNAACVGAVQDLIGLKSTDFAILKATVEKASGGTRTLNVDLLKEKLKPLQQVLVLKQLLLTLADLVTLGVQTKGDPMTVRFTASPFAQQ